MVVAVPAATATPFRTTSGTISSQGESAVVVLADRFAMIDLTLSPSGAVQLAYAGEFAGPTLVPVLDSAAHLGRVVFTHGSRRRQAVATQRQR